VYRIKDDLRIFFGCVGTVMGSRQEADALSALHPVPRYGTSTPLRFPKAQCSLTEAHLQAKSTPGRDGSDRFRWGFIPERWAASNRYAGRDQFVTVGDIISVCLGDIIGIRIL
jgi:hypothetical protein